MFPLLTHLRLHRWVWWCALEEVNGLLACVVRTQVCARIKLAVVNVLRTIVLSILSRKALLPGLRGPAVMV